MGAPIGGIEQGGGFMKKLLLGGSIIAVLGTTLFADLSENAGTAVITPFAVPFTARQVAMGEAFSAMVDINSMLYNPATLALLNKPYFTASHLRWLIDFSKSYVAMGMPTELGYFSGGVVYNDMGRFDVWQNGECIEEGRAVYDMGFIMGYAGRFHQYLTIGTNAKILLFDWAGRTASAIGGDFGIFIPYIPIFNRNSFFSIGLAVQDVGTKIKFVEAGETWPQPQNIRGGISLITPNIGNLFDLNIGVEVQYPNDQALRYGVGGELWIIKMLALRAGYKDGGYDFDDEKLTYGAGIKVGNFIVDYAYVNYGEFLESTHRITASIELMGEKKPGPVSIVDDQWDELMERFEVIHTDITDVRVNIDEAKEQLRTEIETIITKTEIMHLPEIRFPFNSAVIPEEDYPKVAELAEIILKYYKDKTITIEGHCDEAGTPEYNMKLSRDRAVSVKKALVEIGIPAEHLVVVPKGETEILTHRTGPGSSGTENRRVVIILW